MVREGRLIVEGKQGSKAPAEMFDVVGVGNQGPDLLPW